MNMAKQILAISGLILALFTSAGLAAQSPPAASEDPAHQELRQLRDGLVAAMNKGDLETALTYLHTNVVITWHNAEVSRGHAGVREYNNRVMTGPNKLVDSFNCTINVDELTILYGGDTGICFGSSDEHFKLANGRNLDIKGRWSATLVKENGKWLVANLHASTNLFNNTLLQLARKAAIGGSVGSLIVGIICGWLIGRRRKPAAVGPA
jgi:ketosteroid isomerase-like protein